MSGWTAPATWVDGPLEASDLNEQVRDNLLALNPPPVIKAADESLNLSTTLQNDNELACTVVAGTFEFEVLLAVTSATNAAGDFRVGFSFPTGVLNLFGFGPDVSLASGNIGTTHHGNALAATSGTSALAFGCSTTASSIALRGTLVCSAGGTLQLMWAQQASHADNTTVKAGSYMRVRQGAA